ncbi:MAG TPA: hypothetical protein VED63_05095, partial [Acidimicrobiales bacterium]|nr:hypothetical protein [Acidimicrobiales bacterium]
LEVLIVVIVVPALIGGMAAVLITSYQNDGLVSSRESNSSDATITSVFFVRDVESASIFSTSMTPICAPSGVTTGQVLGLQWGQNGEATTVSYVWTPPDLVRYACEDSSIPVSTGYLSTDEPSVAPSVTISCGGFGCQPDPDGIWPPGAVSSVSMNVDDGASSLSPYQYQVSAAPRTETNPGGGGSPPTTADESSAGGAGLGGEYQVPPLLLLGSGASELQIVGALNTLSVNDTNGPIYVNSSAENAVDLDGVLVNVDATPVANGLDISNGASTSILNQGATCGFRLFGYVPWGTCYPAPTDTTSTQPDPLADATVPAVLTSDSPGCSPASGGSPSPTSVISGSDNPNWTCYPGLYPSGLTISGNDNTVTFAAGNYQFGTPSCSSSACGFEVAESYHGNSLQFGSGVYAFEGTDASDNCQGGYLNTSSPEGGVGIEGGSNTLIGTGVLFYVAGGQTNFGCGALNSVDLTSSTSASSDYDNIVLWQDKSDPLPVVLSKVLSGGNSSDFYGGVLYAPTAQVQLTGFAEKATASSIVANGLQIIGAGDCLTVGSTSDQCP